MLALGSANAQLAPEPVVGIKIFSNRATASPAPASDDSVAAKRGEVNRRRAPRRSLKTARVLAPAAERRCAVATACG